MKANDGGPAFPRPTSIDPSSGTLPDGDDVIEEQDGMALRDYFAAAALTGYLAMFAGADGSPDACHAAKRAYQHADAMLARRTQVTVPSPDKGES